MVLPIEKKPIRVGVNLTPLNPGSVGGIMPLGPQPLGRPDP